jgi:transcriptional regulator with XRE-family HTH domain
MSKTRTQSEMGNNIRKFRIELGLTQIKVAEKSKISINYYARVERGEVNPSVKTLESILKALNVKSSRILPF